MFDRLCPRCNKRFLHEKLVLNCLSRRDNKTYICKICGKEEAIIDMDDKGLFNNLPDEVIFLHKLRIEQSLKKE